MSEQELRRKKIESILEASETMTDNPPYICLPAGSPEWIQLKTLRLSALIKEAIPELAREPKIEEAYKAGERKVVEWIKASVPEGYDQWGDEKPRYLLYIDKELFQEFLKSEGIE